jgi:hypothetical protein
MRYKIIEVTDKAAITCEVAGKSKALSRFALLRAEPTTLYAQITEVGGAVIKQYARHAASVQNMELEA